MEEQEHTSAPKILIITIALAVIIIFGFLVYRLQVKKNADQPQDTQQEQPEDGSVVTGSMRLESGGGRGVFATDGDISLFLYVDSDGQKVGGYDAVLDLNPDEVELVEAVSLIDGIQIHTNTDAGVISVTGIKDLQNEDAYTFENIPVAEIILRTSSEGQLPIDFVFEEGETFESNLVTPTSQDILGDVMGTSVLVGSTVTLTPGTPVVVDDIGTEAELLSVQMPDEQCVDCFTEANIRLSNGDLEETFTFELGGFIGKLYASHEFGDKIFEVSSVETSSVDMTVGSISTPQTDE